MQPSGSQPGKPAGAGKSDTPAPVNTIRISGADLSKLHALLSAGGDKHHVKRGFVRWPFQRETVRVELPSPGATPPRSCTWRRGTSPRRA